MKPLLLTFTLLRATDLSMTQVVLAHGGVELNPVYSQNRSLNLVEGVGTTAGFEWFAIKLSKRSKLAGKLVLVAGIATSAYTSGLILKRVHDHGGF